MSLPGVRRGHGPLAGARVSIGRLGLVYSLAATLLLGWLLSRSDWEALSRPLLALQPGWIGLAVLVHLAVELVKTWRWQHLLGAPPSTLGPLLATVLASRLLNALAPLRAGDLWRVTLATRSQNRPWLAAGGAFVLEKLLDSVALGVLGLITLGLTLPSERLPVGLVVLLLVGLGSLVWLRRRGRWPAGLASALRALRHLRQPALLLGLLLLTALALGLGLLVNALVLQALALPISARTIALMLLAGYAAGALPAAPAQLGVFELAVAAPLIAGGLTAPEAVAAALGLHLTLLVGLASGGLIAALLSSAGLVRPTPADQRVEQPVRDER